MLISPRSPPRPGPQRMALSSSGNLHSPPPCRAGVPSSELKPGSVMRPGGGGPGPSSSSSFSSLCSRLSLTPSFQRICKIFLPSFLQVSFSASFALLCCCHARP